MARFAVLAGLFLLLPGAGNAADATESACATTKAPVQYALISTPPLLAAHPDSSTSIEVRADGCVVAHSPGWRRDAGTRFARLPAIDMERLRADIAATGVARVEVGNLRADLRRAQFELERETRGGERRIVKVSDEPIIEVTVAAEGGPRTLLWHSLREDLANHPDIADLHAIAAAVQRLHDVAREIGREVQQ